MAQISLQQAPLDLVSRDELVRIAQGEGLDLSVRTLRYWAQHGLIPRPWRVEGEGLRAFYSLSLLKRLRVLASTRPGSIKKIRDSISEAESLQFGRETFRVLPAIASWERRNTRFSVRMLEDGSGMLLIQRKKNAP